MRKERLKEVMRKKQHNAASLAELSGIAERTIWRLLQDDKGTTDETAAKIAIALEVSTDYLLGISDDPAPALRVDNLTDQERAVLSALRRGEPLEAIALIAVPRKAG